MWGHLGHFQGLAPLPVGFAHLMQGHLTGLSGKYCCDVGALALGPALMSYVPLPQTSETSATYRSMRRLSSGAPLGEGGAGRGVVLLRSAWPSFRTMTVYTSFLKPSNCLISSAMLCSSTSLSISASHCLRTSSFSCKLSFNCDNFICSGASSLRRAVALFTIRVADARCPATTTCWLSVSVQSDRVSLGEPSTTEKGFFYPARRTMYVRCARVTVSAMQTDLFAACLFVAKMYMPL
jgi:hypothetical protein